MKKKVIRKAKDPSVTTDELATMVAAGFSSLEKRLDARIDGVEAKIGSLHSEVLSIHFDHRKLKARLEGVEVKVFGSIQEA